MSHCHWRNQWDRVVWSDEASVRLKDSDGRLRLWIKSDQEIPRHLHRPRVQGGATLLIWAGIWTNGRSELHIQQGTMNSERYVNVLRMNIGQMTDQLGDPSTWLFMDDNATCHRSSRVNLCKSQLGLRTLSWPARSPDLNPIENVWSILKRNVRRSLLPTDGVSQLTSLLKREWRKLDQSKINDIIESMPRRIGNVIDNKGRATKY
jgi:hypothetical protein